MLSRYIVIEGLEGSGKTSAVNVVGKTIHELGIKKIIYTREPGGTYLAEKLRSLVLNTKLATSEIIHNKTEILIFYAARVQLVETIIKPALSSGSWVVAERHDLSTQAYQGGGRGVNYKMISNLRKLVLGNFQPNLTLYLDITPQISFERLRTNNANLDRIEQESLDFFERTYRSYLRIISRNKNIKIINAMQPIEHVSNAIREIIIHWFHKELK